MSSKPKIVPMGDAAVLIQLGNEIHLKLNRRVHALAALIEHSAVPGIIETVPAYSTLLVHYDPNALSMSQIKRSVNEMIAQTEEAQARAPRTVEVAVVYGGEHGVDLDLVAKTRGLTAGQVVRIHSEQIYTVYMLGFTAGFAYMGKLDDAIVMPRMDSPRTRVAAGTVAIAGSQTGIYPIDSPGGWRLIGHTSMKLVDLDAPSPFLFSPGDQVRFIAEK